jgi:phage terminase large subunit GpA-like protein
MRFETLEEMIAASATGIRPPERLTVAEAAEKYRYLDNPGSYRGFWNNEMAPYLVEPMEVLTSPDYIGEIFVGPARTGKSDMFHNWIAHTSKCDPADMMGVFMSQATARDWSNKDLKRMFRHSKDIGKLVTPGRSGHAAHNVRFLSGMNLEIKWPSITELSGKTVPRVWLADYDRMPESIDGEGSPYDLGAKRTTTYRRNAMTVAESSPGFEIEDPKWSPRTPHEAPPTRGILSLYNRGDRRRWYWKCPGCKTAVEPRFSLLQIPDSADHVEAAEATVMVMPCCGQIIWHDGLNGVPGKHELNQIKLGNARWVMDGQKWMPDGSLEGTAFRSNIASFWMKGPAALFTDWRDLALKYLKAMEEFERTGSQESLKTTVNTDQGEPFMPVGLDAGRLAEDVKAMAQDLGERVVPKGVRFLLALVDVQLHRFEIQVVGVGVGGDLTVIDRFAIRRSNRLDEEGEKDMISPASYLEDWDVLIEKAILRTYPLGDGSGRRMKIKMTGCDSAGSADLKNDSSVTKNAYNFYRRLRDSDGTEIPADLHRRFKLLKGNPNKRAPTTLTTWPDSSRKDRHADARGEIPVLLLNANALKDTLNVMLDRKVPGGGKVNFPSWLPAWFWNEMVAEVRDTDGWRKTQARNEAWDLLVYAMAILHSMRGDMLDWDDPEGCYADWYKNDLVFDPSNASATDSDDVEDLDIEAIGALLS